MKSIRNSFFKVAAILGIAFSMAACERIPTGSTGLRVNMSKEVQSQELMPGSWNQTVVGSVLVFPVKDIPVSLENKTPMTAENTALADFDVTIVYAINPQSVAELYSTKSHSFHSKEQDGDVLLMYNYMTTLVNNASYKVVRNYTNLQAADNRQKIEEEIRTIVTNQLKEEGLDNSLSLNVVQVRNILPNAAVLESATNLVRSQNDLKVKENEIRIAEAEAKRMQMLTANAGQSIAYMRAQSEMMIAEAVKDGKVQTVLIPHGMTMFGGVGK